ncbi:MBL fold metallo-hydrolase [uncultured Pseudacidovorax sp.]|uniref:MBL fold metallo-hydrolase n=1 Tax=uncultured Pseudacidovorax sp. TaxID=679313 RepID=UPI0025ECCF81|nr:MBL fold metallo-hydrolase [uncultured Pseudacidovorax sp.]
MPIELYRDAQHACLMFTDLVRDGGEAVQCNQFLLIDQGVGAIIDPGGNIAFNELFLGMTRHFPPNRLSYLIASHADPDIIASLDRWLTTTSAQLVISRIWARFAPHFAKSGKTTERVLSVPDAGGRLRLGGSELWLLPAHFLHSEGNFQFYDPVSRILFSGDLGASMVGGAEAQTPVTDFVRIRPHMEAFHRRYMVSNKVMQLWVRMARQLDIALLVPQHGAPLAGPAIGAFLDWAESLQCGIDLLGQDAYLVPSGVLG